MIVSVAPGVVVDNVAIATNPNNCRLTAAPAGKLAMIVALNEPVATAGEFIVPASGLPLTVIRELTSKEAVKFIV